MGMVSYFSSLLWQFVYIFNFLNAYALHGQRTIGRGLVLIHLILACFPTITQSNVALIQHILCSSAV